jgi:magnesium transporter
MDAEGILNAAQQPVLETKPREEESPAAEVASGENPAWSLPSAYPEGTIGRMMEPPLAVFPPHMTIAEATEELRELVKKGFITYAFVVDESEALLGVIVMRELLLGRDDQLLEEIMIPKPFFLTPELGLTDAMRAVLNKHYPVYPICEPGGKLLGLVRGQNMFEAEAIEISSQAGRMVGVEKEERLSTPWRKSLMFRHPWLQLNLLTAFAAAFVVGIFQGTIDRIVILAMFLPVLAGQSGNTGCQALAVALRGMTLGELEKGRERALLIKEGLLGLLNGALVGLTAGIGMFIVATLQSNSHAMMLSLIVFIAMVASCVISGVVGGLVPLVLRKLGADPATASSIFLTTATDVASMGIFLGLATLLL